MRRISYLKLLEYGKGFLIKLSSNGNVGQPVDVLHDLDLVCLDGGQDQQVPR